MSNITRIIVVCIIAIIAGCGDNADRPARALAADLADALCAHLHAGTPEAIQCGVFEYHALCQDRCTFRSYDIPGTPGVVADCEPGACTGAYAGDADALEACISALAAAPASASSAGEMPAACGDWAFDVTLFEEP